MLVFHINKHLHNSRNLVRWHIFRKAKREQDYCNECKAEEQTVQKTASSSSSSLYKLHFHEIPADHKWHHLIRQLWEVKKKVYLYIWLLCRLFDILDMPFSLQYIMRLYLTSAGIFSFCFKDYPANWMSTCFHHCIVKKKKRGGKKEEEDEAANYSAETNYSPNFPFEIPARGRAPTFLILVTELA